MSRILLLSFVLATTASAECASGYTCCSQWDFFIPVMTTCIQNEPSGANNCARNDQSKVPFWARLETPEWRRNGVCTDKTPTMTRAQLEEKERKAREFQEKFDEYCVKNEAHCSANETCYYNKTHLDGHGGSVWSGAVTDMGPACVCQFAAGQVVNSSASEYARANTDGTGACVLCASGPNGTSPFVQRPEEPGAKTFHNGEFACAFGTAKSVKVNTFQI